MAKGQADPNQENNIPENNVGQGAGASEANMAPEQPAQVDDANGSDVHHTNDTDEVTNRVQAYEQGTEESAIEQGLVMYIGTKVVEAKPMDGKTFTSITGRVMGEGEGYLVRYEDGFKSWSPKDVFEAAYKPTTGLSYGLACDSAANGEIVARKGWWDADGNIRQVVIKQVHADIPNDIIPKMTSLPDKFKAMADKLPNGLHYRHQMLLVQFPSGMATSYVPDTFDQAATDWMILKIDIL
jgi:hypothetical protein